MLNTANVAEKSGTRGGSRVLGKREERLVFVEEEVS